MSDEQTVAAERLYGAMAAKDPAAILAALHEEFIGDVSAGMPLGVGGRHEGPQAMLGDVWGPIFRAYEVSVDVDEYLRAGTDRVVAVGTYRGRERETGRPLDAAFAHVLAIRDGRVSALAQITDTRAWLEDVGAR